MVNDLKNAWRVLLLTLLGRELPDLYEWKALYSFVHTTPNIPDKEPKLGEVIKYIAKLGGFMGRNGEDYPD